MLSPTINMSCDVSEPRDDPSMHRIRWYAQDITLFQNTVGVLTFPAVEWPQS